MIKDVLNSIGKGLKPLLLDLAAVVTLIGLIVCIPFGSLDAYRHPAGMTNKQVLMYFFIGTMFEIGFIILIIWGLLKW